MKNAEQIVNYVRSLMVQKFITIKKLEAIADKNDGVLHFLSEREAQEEVLREVLKYAEGN